MNNKRHIDSKEIQIQGLLDHYLKFSSKNTEIEPDAAHLDEDFLTAFIEGNIDEREAKPIVSHLALCEFCRHISAELIKLDYAFAGDEHHAEVASKKPESIGSVLNGILSRIFGTNDEAVFAHNEEKEDTPGETPKDDSEEE